MVGREMTADNIKYFKERSHAWSEVRLLVMCASYFYETRITSKVVILRINFELSGKNFCTNPFIYFAF